MVARLPATHPIEVLREQIAPDATDAELAFFAEVCARLELSPFADQIVLIGRYDKRVGRPVHRHQLTVAGRRTLATRTGRLAGIEGPVWCGPRDATGALVWTDVWDHDEPPYCARVLVHVAGWTVPSNGTAKWDEFAQHDSSGKLLPTWRQMPSLMLGKCAESMALRRAFPDVIDPAIADNYPLPVDGPDEDLAELAEASAVNAIHEPAPAARDGFADAWRASLDTGTVDAGWQPANIHQSAAHKAIGALGESERDVFLTHWDIEDFSEVWPAGAVADALGMVIASPEQAP